MRRLLFDHRWRRVSASLWAIAWFAVAALLLLPLGVATPGRGDLVGHFLLFATMAFAAVGFSRRPKQLAWLALVSVGLGMMLELAQGFVPWRTSEIADAAANAAGGLAGYGAALLVLYFVIRPAEPRFDAAAP